jgi:very-short-patch-repair endonuclease
MQDPPSGPTWHVESNMRMHAKALRRDSTDAERIIWRALRAHRMNGASFRRQTPIGPYIVDFVCHSARVIIELDGGQHFQAEHRERDARRDRFLTRKGYRVLRFNNHEVMTNREGVLEMIAGVLGEAPSPASGRGGVRGSGGVSIR